MSFLKIKNLSVDYPMRKETVYAAKDVNIEVNKGEILGLVGESGSGKSTVGNAIINLIDARFRDTIDRNSSFKNAYDHLYWQAAGVNHATGEKSILINQFMLRMIPFKRFQDTL